MVTQPHTKPRPSGRASIPTPAVRFPNNDSPRQLTRKQRNANKSKGFFGWLISFASRVTIFYLIYAALWTCPSRPFAFDYSAKDPRPVCRNLAQAHQQIAPIVTPYLHLAQQKAEPYTRPIVQAATPWINRAQTVSRPIYRQVNKRGRLIWKKRIDPARKRALKKARKQLDPYLTQAHQYHKRNIQPHVDTARNAVKPYQDIYQRDISPYVDQAYKYSLHSSSVSYAFYVDKVHPHVVQGLKQIYSFFVNYVDPAVRRFYSIYVRPQLDRLLEKVYERKAHWLGSDAIKSAQSEMKHAEKLADQHAKQSIKKAEDEAIQTQNDPSILDRVKQAKQAVFDTSTIDDRIKTAALDAELDAEEEKAKELLEVWENGMTDLIEKEYKLAIDRIADLRNRRLSDLPDRFGLVNEAFVEDTVALILNRVERGVRKISNSNLSAEKKLEAGQRLVDAQIAKFDDAASATKAEIAGFYEVLLQQERETIETSSAEVRRYGAAAKEAYDGIMKGAKFAATMDEWHGWDTGVRKRASLFAEELNAVQSNKKAVRTASGAVDLRKEAPDMQKEINGLRAHTEKLHSSARNELVAYCVAAVAQLGGEGIAAKISDITDRLAEQANRISTDAAAGMLGAVGSARSKLGLGEPASEGYVARAKAYVASGTGSGSAFNDYISSLNANLNANLNAAGASVSSIAAQASSSVASAVGVSTPASAKASSAAVNVASNAQAAAFSASSAVSKASRNAASALGASPTPETFEDYVDASTAGVEAAVDSAVASAGSVSASASSVASKVSRSVASAVGASPTPETAGDYVEAIRDNVVSAAGKVGEMAESGVFSPASSLVSVASSAVGAAAGDGVSSASSVASIVGKSVESGASSASSIASKASRSAASAFGASPTPETLGDYLEDARDAAQKVSRSASSGVSVVYASASSAGASVASVIVDNDGVESLSRVANAAASSISSAAQVGSKSLNSYASQASEGASSVVDPMVSNAASIANSATKSAESVLESASSLVSKASRSAASAVGASPTPNTIDDYVEDAKDALKNAAARVHVEL
ncbi:uncharacterized protein MEPE_05827 [Melanopsichium pennsylvanicum]|uniref:Uncharacterized protein n=2 Tax=Melanopsichium pennsylvanicum TaxID=63383 RepID=A0AAJ4XSM5_9BASI|nr:conserved hypothetical protein [Melanopsichium pennsylvanicum 4]SNX87117.1 uncharacterized protein MEPE_05827 [Melanopsichium pennsylvanicum]